MKNSLLLLLAILSLNISAQEIWQKFYKDASINNFAYTPDNEFILCGYGFEQDTTVVELLRADSMGNVFWRHDLKFTETIRYTQILAVPDSGSLLAVTGDQVLLFYKFSGDNELQWEKRIEIESRYLRNVQMYWEDESRSCVFVVNDCDPACSVFIGKLSKTGDLLWIREHTEGDMLACVSALLYSEHDYYFLMSTDEGTLVYKTYADGQKWWSKRLETGFYEKAVGMLKSPQGNLQILFNTSPSEQIVLAETDLRGNIIWQKEYPEGLVYVLAANACRTVADGTAIFGSMEIPGIIGVQNFILNLDAHGDSLWVYHPKPEGIPAGIVRCNDGNLAFLTLEGSHPPRLAKIKSDWLVTALDEPQKGTDPGIHAAPNPFSNQTCFYNSSKIASTASHIQIFDLRGRMVCSIPINGQSKVYWNACDEANNKLKSGVYLYRAVGQGLSSEYHKMIVSPVN